MISPTPRGRTRHVSGAALSQRRDVPDCCAEKLLTSRANSSSSYAPGVHLGSESRTGSVPPTVKVIVEVTCRRAALARVKVTSYRMSLSGAEVAPTCAAAGAAMMAIMPATAHKLARLSRFIEAVNSRYQ